MDNLNILADKLDAIKRSLDNLESIIKGGIDNTITIEKVLRYAHSKVNVFYAHEPYIMICRNALSLVSSKFYSFDRYTNYINGLGDYTTKVGLIIYLRDSEVNKDYIKLRYCTYCLDDILAHISRNTKSHLNKLS